MTTPADLLANLSLVRFGFFHAQRGEGFGALLLVLVLFAVVVWVLLRSVRDAA